MNSRQVLVFGDGRHELGDRLDQSLTPDQLPALPRLVHRLLKEPTGTTYTCRYSKDVPRIHGRRHRYAKKAIWAIVEASRNDFDAVVIVIDRDRRVEKETIQPLREGRDSCSISGKIPCAVGCAVETFDAWMIADGNAIKHAGGVGNHKNPESLYGKEGKGKHPKDIAANIFDGKRGLSKKYAIVAENVDLLSLEKTCPKGFKPFANDVREKILSAISN
ncbi:MAG: DUF4276 family protein [Planctomycetota bacterium]|nr:DUF4276 family protein [Planctomycetota bacterium]